MMCVKWSQNCCVILARYEPSKRRGKCEVSSSVLTQSRQGQDTDVSTGLAEDGTQDREAGRSSTVRSGAAVVVAAA